MRGYGFMTIGSRRVLRYTELAPVKGIPFTIQHLGRLERRERFPRRVKIGLRLVGWFEDELDAYLEAQAAKRLKQRSG